MILLATRASRCYSVLVKETMKTKMMPVYFVDPETSEVVELALETVTTPTPLEAALSTFMSVERELMETA